MSYSHSVSARWAPDGMEDGALDGASEEEIELEPPVHPVPTMQGAFEESLAETLNDPEETYASDRKSIADSTSRRKMLLEQQEYERTVAGRWKQRPGEKFHPLWKLVAQISFGMHLLQQRMAKSDEEVIKILQTHVDEIDGFLERTTEDFDLAQGDINERIRYLKLPLEHTDVFDTMLNDRNFRIAIVEGNEKIEHIIDRTAAAMNDALKDVQKGLDATRELAKYLTRLDKNWDDRTEEHDSVYLAMIGNTEGWSRAFLDLQAKGNTLRKALVQLGGIVAEMQRRAGAASRKNLVPVRAINGRYYVDTASPSMKSPAQIMSPPLSPKPLPYAPNSNSSSPPSRHISMSAKRPLSRSGSRQGDYPKHTTQDRPVSRSVSRAGDYATQIAQQRAMVHQGKHNSYQQPLRRSSSKKEYDSSQGSHHRPLSRSASRQGDYQHHPSRKESQSLQQHHPQYTKNNSFQDQSKFAGFWSMDHSRVGSQEHSRSSSLSNSRSTTRKFPQPSATPLVEVSSYSDARQIGSSTTSRMNGDMMGQKWHPELQDAALTAPQIAQAVSARRVSPQMRMNSSERIQVVRTPESKASSIGRRPSTKANEAQRKSEQAPMVRDLEEAESAPPVPQRSASHKSSDRPPPREPNTRPSPKQVNDDDDDDRSDTDLPIQNPPTPKARTPPSEKVPPPPSHRRSNSGKRVTIVSNSDYSSSPTSPIHRFGTPITREASPAIHNIPSHGSYNTNSFLPLHPALSPLADPRESFGEPFNHQIPLRRPSTAARSATVPITASKVIPTPILKNTHIKPSISQIASSMKIAPDDSEGAVNTAHPLLQAERHNRFATRTTPGTPTTREEKVLRHYRSQDTIRRPTPDSEEKEVFVPPKRASSFDQNFTKPIMSPDVQTPTSTSAPTITTTIPPPNEVHSPGSGPTAPTPNSHLAPLSPQSSTSEALSANGATPPAISRTRSPIPVSRSTPDLPNEAQQRASVMSADLPHPGRKIPSGTTQATPFYLNPVSSAAMIDFLGTDPPATTPPTGKKSSATKSEKRPFSPLPLGARKVLNVFPSTKPIHINGTSVSNGTPSGATPRAIPILNPIGSSPEKKSWKRFFGHGKFGSTGGNPKISAPMMLVGNNTQTNGNGNGFTSPTKKSKKGGRFMRHGGAKTTGVATPDSLAGGFMGVGKDGVWISRKNFLKG